MRIRGLLIAAALLLLPIAPAWADWGPTHWGMTLQQVLDSVPGVRPLKYDGKGGDVFNQHRLASAPWHDGEIALIADFFFDPGASTLSLVKSEPTDVAQCAAYGDLLVARYGPGAREEKSFDNGLTIMAIRWTDQTTHERLIYSRLGDTGKPANYCHFIVQKPA